MPVQYKIDHDLHIVRVSASGRLTSDELFAYQAAVWSQASVRGYNEIMDAVNVTHVGDLSRDRVRELAQYAADMDAPEMKSKFAIVAPHDLHFGLGRMYSTLRDCDTRSTKEVCVFRTAEEAETWIGLTDDSRST